MSNHIFSSTNIFGLESGQLLDGIEIAYTTAGRLNADGSNVVWVCHALTGSADVTEWWDGLFGKGKLYDPAQYFIVCANVLGSCYGSTGPLSTNPTTGQVFYQYFPQVTVRDWVKAHQLLAKHLGLNHIHTLIGGSIGGQQALEWAIDEPERFEHLILIATNAAHSPWGIAFNEAQRLAIKADRTYYSQSVDAGKKGLQAARAIAMISYRHYDAYLQTQSEEDTSKLSHYRAASYLSYQGQKLVNRFNAYSYMTLTKAMDSHHIGRNRDSIVAALSVIQAKTLVIGITSDVLFPIAEQRYLAEHIAGATFREIESMFGHDGFLVEYEQLAVYIAGFYNSQHVSGLLSIENEIV